MSEFNFGITQETRSEGVKLFPAPKKLTEENKQFPTGYKFPNGRLVNVVANAEFETKDGNRSVLQFTFKGSKGETFTHTEWNLEPTDPKMEGKMGALQSRIKHILEQVGLNMPEKGIGVGAKNFDEFFTSVANTFNSQTITVEKEGEEPKSVKKYYQTQVYLKLVYNRSNLNFPYLPNFIQTATKDGKASPCQLGINLQYDTLEQSATNSNTFNNVGGGATAGGDLSDLPDFT